MTDRRRRKHTHVLDEVLGAAPLRLADVGCGYGALAQRLAGRGHDVIGADPQWQAVQAAAAADTEARFLVAAGEALPLADGCRDRVIFFNALHHVPVAGMDTAVAEAHRVLAPGGRLVAVEPLPEGAMFELVRPVDDETEVRQAAEAALQRAAAAGTWRRTRRVEYLAPATYESFAAFRDHLIAVDPARAPAVQAHEADMRADFYRLAQDGEAGYAMDQPCRLTELQRLD